MILFTTESFTLLGKREEKYLLLKPKIPTPVDIYKKKIILHVPAMTSGSFGLYLYNSDIKSIWNTEIESSHLAKSPNELILTDVNDKLLLSINGQQYGIPNKSSKDVIKYISYDGPQAGIQGKTIDL